MATQIHVRDIDFDLDGTRATDWNAGDTARTTLWNALSILFPLGERFFIQSVVAYRSRVSDPKLLEAVRAFVTQEALHTREHLAYNAALRTFVDVPALEARIAEHLDFIKTVIPPLGILAVTCALEHFTAIMAREVLDDPAYLAGAQPAYARLWTWHALEECEHKSVAFDVFSHVTRERRRKAYGLRIRVMALATLTFVRFTAAHIVKIMKSLGLAKSPRAWFALLSYIFVRPGLARRIIIPYFRYYAPGFHPEQSDDRRVIDAARARVETWDVEAPAA